MRRIVLDANILIAALMGSRIAKAESYNPI